MLLGTCSYPRNAPHNEKEKFRVGFLFTIAAGMLAAATSSVQERADRFLALANTGCQALYRANSGAQWKAVTDVTLEHDAAAEATGKASAAFTGNPAIIKKRAIYSRIATS